ncbi:tRNA (adenosine(37)-N6)-dimethylallyltransferase MiaA [Microgenomates group bacterium RBG_19FT_COMBO_39_10]|nr:MAG: tRNA (adenosine(37)-N6)-dimethylallyltransferase MiaA [Microgenomates group bacterium RBG_19FT_COMBO_39_10]
MKKLLIICGLTATGKTALAVRLSRKFKVELISADSRQIYQGLDIGTGKDHPKAIKIHLINIIKPNQEFSVSQYYRLVWQAIKKIWKKNKLPILVGGTGFYIKAVIDGLATKDIPPSPRIREGMKDWSSQKLYQYLEELDPIKTASLNQSDRRNPRRLIRAIEIVAWKKENPEWQPKKHQQPSVLFIGLKTDYQKIYQRIDKRVEERIKKGAEKEVKKLIDQGYSWDLPAMNAMGYLQWKPFFEGKVDRETVIECWQMAEHAFARRQMTWFKKDKRIDWFDINQKGWENRVEDLVKKWYSKSDA